jgi:trans-AT polyketide synthase/acyltransferase/oxidoreductase domain-containing protein
MRKPLVFLFSGQGSQQPSMGRDLMETDPAVRAWLDRLDVVVRDTVGVSVLESVYRSGPTSEVLDRTLITHPAICMLEVALARALCEGGVEPDLVLGASLGDFAALAVAGACAPEDAVRTAALQARFLERYCANDGGMVAVFDDLGRVERHLSADTSVAAVNHAGHFVVSGGRAAIEATTGRLAQASVAHQKLPVQHGFHSAHIDPAELPFLAALDGLELRRPHTKLLSCVGTGDGSANAHRFWAAVRQPVRFAEPIARLEEAGGAVYLDLGPSGTLAGFVRKLLPEGSASEVHAALSPFGRDRERWENLRSRLRQSAGIASAKERQMNVFLFPGQGSQKKGMGAGLFEQFPELTAAADAILGYSVRDLCLTDPQGALQRTEFTQPALFVVNALTWQKQKASGLLPDFAAGHSLGEYNALLAAGVFDFETGLRLVKKRGALMAKVGPGAMAAVVGISEETVARVLRDGGLAGIDVANLNSPLQVVISGPEAEVSRAREPLMAAGCSTFVPLKVSGAFHSRYMQPVRDEFSAWLRSFDFAAPSFPVLSNVTGRPHVAGAIAEALAEQIVKPVRWSDSILHLCALGRTNFVELGPGNVLTGLVRRIQNEAAQIAASASAGPKPASASSMSAPSASASAAPPIGFVGGPTAIHQAATPPEIAASSATTLTSKMDAISTASTGRAGNGGAGRSGGLRAEAGQRLGSEAFKRAHAVRYAYVIGGMYRGISSVALVTRAARAGYLSFFGAAGLSLTAIRESVRNIRSNLDDSRAFGVSLLPALREEEVVDLLLEEGIKTLEVSSYLQLTSALVRFRFKGATGTGPQNRILAKVSRPEMARAFMSPAPVWLVDPLLRAGRLTAREAELARTWPMADDICADACSWGDLGQASALSLLPAVVRMRAQLAVQFPPALAVRVGAAGGIGTPEAAAAAFVMGADFILTGSINQCTPEAATNTATKDLLQSMDVQDTDYAPIADTFELGTKVPVLRKGLFYAPRANKLLALYKQLDAIDGLDAKTRVQIEGYFGKDFAQMFDEAKVSLDLPDAERWNPKDKRCMAAVFKGYLVRAAQNAVSDDGRDLVDRLVPCSPALGAFNRWVQGTELEDWRCRHVERIAGKLMEEAAALLHRAGTELGQPSDAGSPLSEQIRGHSRAILPESAPSQAVQ